MATGRLNKKSTLKAFNEKIEMVEQAELGIAHDNTPISFYVVRALKEVAAELELKVTHTTTGLD